ncbi:hypothetical protein AMTRI_Chr08g161760 [Amborella trichopoda]
MAENHFSCPEPDDRTYQSPLISPCSSPGNILSSPWFQTVEPTDHGTESCCYRCLASAQKPSGEILSLAVTENGLIYAGSNSKSITVWKLPEFVEHTRLKSGSGFVTSIIVSSDDKLVFSAHSDHKIRTWSIDGSGILHFRTGTLPCFRDRILDACRNYPKSLFSRENKSTVKHLGTITCLAYNSAIKVLYSSSKDGTVKVWSLREMKCVETIRAHRDAVNALVVGADGLLFTGSDDTAVKVWRKSLSAGCTHSLVLNLQVKNSPVKAMVLGCEGDDRYLVYAGCSDGYVHYWRKGQLSGHMSYTGFLRGHTHAIMCMASSDKIVVSGAADSSVCVWLRGGGHRCLAVINGHVGPIRGVGLRVDDDDDGFVVYSGSMDGAVKVWWVWSKGRGSRCCSEEVREGEDEYKWDEYFELPPK